MSSRLPIIVAIAWLMTAATQAAAPTTRRGAPAPAREKFAAAKSYYCFYAAGHVAELSRYDVAILHIPKMTPPNVRALNDAGVVTIGYISVGEDEELRVGNGNGPAGKASWYLDKDHDGQPDQNGIWKSWYANAGDPEWRADRLEAGRRLVDEYGFNGFFLDTIEMPDIYPEARPGMIQLVEELRRAFPDKVIVANRAFSLLKEPRVAANIDGIMYESFSSHYDFDAKRYIRFSESDLDGTRKVVEQNVLPIMKQYPRFRVLALDYTAPDDAEWIQLTFDRAATFGFLPCVAPIDLDDVYNVANVVGHRNERYLKKLATPETMQVRLAEPRNGFPAGTIVRPSGSYPGYTVAPVVDGIRDRGTLPWWKRDWASEEEPVEHSLTLLPGKPISGGRLRITYTLPSQKFTVEVRERDAAAWTTLQHADANRQKTMQVSLPDQAISAIRITQPAGGGNEQRPNLMWVEQVELLPP
jgi:hypothetical protein